MPGRTKTELHRRRARVMNRPRPRPGTQSTARSGVSSTGRPEGLKDAPDMMEKLPWMSSQPTPAKNPPHHGIGDVAQEVAQAEPPQGQEQDPGGQGGQDHGRAGGDHGRPRIGQGGQAGADARGHRGQDGRRGVLGRADGRREGAEKGGQQAQDQQAEKGEPGRRGGKEGERPGKDQRGQGQLHDDEDEPHHEPGAQGRDQTFRGAQVPDGFTQKRILHREGDTRRTEGRQPGAGSAPGLPRGSRPAMTRAMAASRSSRFTGLPT